MQGEDITIYGKGEQTRSFCYVSDLVAGLIAMMEVADFRGPVNLGNPGEFTILSLAEKVIKMTTSPSKLVFNDLPSDDPVRRKPDIGLAKEKLGWSPTIDIDAGLGRTIEYFRQTLDRG